MEHHENDQNPRPGPEHKTENALGSHNIDASVAPAVLSVLNRLGLGKAMRAPGTEEEQLLAELKDTEPSVRMAAVRALGTWREHVPVAALLAALHDADWSVRTAAILVLGKLKHNVPVEALTASLHDKDESVRAAAAWALGEFGALAPLEPLNAALHDSAWSVREAATLALEHMKEAPIAPLSASRLDEKIAVPEAEDHFSDKEAKPSRQNDVYTPTRPFKRRVPARRSRFMRLVEGMVVALVIAGMIIAWLAIASWPRGTSTSHNPPLRPSSFTYRGHTDAVGTVAWSPDGTRIASASADGIIQVWDAFTGHTIFTLSSHAQRVLAMAWSSPGYLLAATAGADGTVRVWDVLTSNNILTTRCPNSVAYTAAWSPDEKRIAFSCGNTSLQVWDIVQGSVSVHKGIAESVTAIAWSPDGTHIAFASYDKTIQVLDAASGKTVRIYRGQADYADQVNTVAWSPDGKHIASGSSDVQVWDAVTGSTILAYHGHLYGVNAVAWSPDGARIVSGSDDGIVEVWDAITGKTIFTYHGHAAALRAIAWSPDGKRIASASDDDTVQVWQVP